MFKNYNKHFMGLNSVMLLFLPHPLQSWQTVFLTFTQLIIFWLLIFWHPWLFLVDLIYNYYLKYAFATLSSRAVFFYCFCSCCCYSTSPPFCISLPSDELLSQAASFWQNQYSFLRFTFFFLFFFLLVTWQVREVSGFSLLLRITNLNQDHRSNF